CETFESCCFVVRSSRERQTIPVPESLDREEKTLSDRFLGDRHGSLVTSRLVRFHRPLLPRRRTTVFLSSPLLCGVAALVRTLVLLAERAIGLRVDVLVQQPA